MKPTFEKSVAILEKAYLKGVLEPMSCAACACGNLLAGYNNLDVVSSTFADTSIIVYDWQHKGKIVPFNTASWSTYAHYGILPEGAMETDLIRRMGYSKEEIYSIEAAFLQSDCKEWNNMSVFLRGKRKDEDMFAALMRVVDKLAEIHGIQDNTRVKAKEEFAKVAT